MSSDRMEAPHAEVERPEPAALQITQGLRALDQAIDKLDLLLAHIQQGDVPRPATDVAKEAGGPPLGEVLARSPEILHQSSARIEDLVSQLRDILL